MFNKLKNLYKKFSAFIIRRKRIVLEVAGALVVGFLIFNIGKGVGDGLIQFGHGHLVSINNSQIKGLPPTLNYGLIQQEYNLIKANYDGNLDGQKLQDGIQAGLAQATGDPYTDYFNPSNAKIFNSQISNSFSGIGAELGENDKNQLVIVAPLASTPAAKAGLQPNDLILSINGKSTLNESVDSAVSAIRGPLGSTVTLVISRGGQQQTYKIVRDTISVPSVNYSIINDNIGYMQITQFSNDTSKLAQDAANSFKSKGVKAIILDLRNNPGGLVTAAVNVSSLWLPQGNTIMIEKHSGQVIQVYSSTGNDILNGIPTVVLINGGSASASEITAGALHDNHDATILGVKSFGKGSVQEIDQLPGGAELKVTIAHWFTPNNKSINHTGIQPDVVVPLSTTDQKNGNDTQKNAAISLLQK